VETRSQDPGRWASRMIGNTLRLAAWTGVWVVTVALAAFGPGSLWNHQPTPTLLAIASSVLVGIGMLFANKRNLHGLDELQRTIQLEAMAWSLGAGLVGGVAWTLFARHELVGVDAEIGHLLAFMAVIYVAGSIAGLLRYR
jgi:hypothetical protein